MQALTNYRTALSYAGVPRVMASSFVCRLLAGMVSLSLLLAAQRETGSYAIAGAVTAAYAVALAFTSPMWGRVADRRGPRAALAIATLLQSPAFALFVLLGVTHAPAVPLVAAAFLAGACTPPGSAVANTVFVRSVPDEQARRTLFALSGLLTESVFIVGPLIVAGVVLLLAPIHAVVVCAITSSAGVWWLRGAAAVRAMDSDRPTLTTRIGLLSNWRQAHIMLVVVLGAFAIGAFEVSVVAHAGELNASAGVLLAVVAIGGAAGSFLYGGAKLPGSLVAQLAVAMTLFGVCILAMGFGPGLIASSVLLFAIGMVNGPADALQSLLVGEYSPREGQSQAFALLNSSNWVGFAAGSAAGGALVQHVSVGFGAAAAALATLAAAASLLVPLSMARRLRPVPVSAR
ncbi:MAG TPA: MFS transporter [Actinophytocola sp.]|jgi:MFS family permease|uniref:MFS transporter n=1 Tax=Actinophytocola sp. TaxID=1872138 RepID=UPI002E0897D4|nr:MFS transporter [Actinophytocola sp.]